jgi:hypothetical protein
MPLVTQLTRRDQDLLVACAFIELGAALDVAGLLPPEHPALDILRSYVAAADAGAFGTGDGLPKPPKGPAVLPRPAVDVRPEETAARQRAARRPTGPSWGRRRKARSQVIDLSKAKENQNGS